MTPYYKLTIPITGEEAQEALIAILNFHTDFESVQQEADQLIFSYAKAKQDVESLKKEIETLSNTYLIEDEPDINWNEQYEKSFEPLILNDHSWGVRASFHEKLDTLQEIIIDPKMSFGTGHHETTRQMMEKLAILSLQNKSVWDYGSGTGILAIMAELRGASFIKANDNEEWAYQNSLENAEINHCSKVKFKLGTINECEQTGFLIPNEEKFEVIIANITKNILIDSAFKISQYSTDGADLLLSGFYKNDIPDIESAYLQHGFYLTSSSDLNQWACLHFQKTN